MPRLFLILGDQLHPDPHPLLTDFDPAQDRLLMFEAAEQYSTPSQLAAHLRRQLIGRPQA